MHPCFIIRGADVLITMDDQRREIKGGDILVRDGVIEAVGTLLYDDDAQIIDGRGTVVTPGLVNTHAHLFQSMTRALPATQNLSKHDGLRHFYPIWARYTPEHACVSAMVGLAELAFSGCSLTADHPHLLPSGAGLDGSIEAAKSVGLRLHAVHDVTHSQGNTSNQNPNSVVTQHDHILTQSAQCIDAFHDPREGAMTRIALGACFPHDVESEVMQRTADVARDKGVMLHSSIGCSAFDVSYTIENKHKNMIERLHDLGWTGADVWLAGATKLDQHHIELLAETQTRMTHTPCSDCRFGLGIAPIQALRNAGVCVGLGTDGGASNDVSNLMSEARQAMLLQRVMNGPEAMTAREALEMATRGGAQVLGRTDLGQISVGMRADIAIWDVADIESAGAWDPAALLLAGPTQVKHLFVEGKHVINNGWLATLDISRVLTRHSALVRGLQAA
ncbi:cytosine/adenosine deaminase-related metal-dependent hydrolase [Pacificibacter maritimus]|uniref:Cytosine/adenosine deaminase-related metal-dependent hydrolase n=1 Tax=Pacificibacter maritimus TaxID=762213 RepID=A0A3N4UNR2_9RHOB|nr:amidohydrolase family protein [Pacificibacter maritimus]RPE72063.1 cytosine/adenosine deaminase-related metal-dependent hydrolase [Pacificibacter maritimus]